MACLNLSSCPVYYWTVFNAHRERTLKGIAEGLSHDDCCILVGLIWAVTGVAEAQGETHFGSQFFRFGALSQWAAAVRAVSTTVGRFGWKTNCWYWCLVSIEEASWLRMPPFPKKKRSLRYMLKVSNFLRLNMDNDELGNSCLVHWLCKFHS